MMYQVPGVEVRGVVKRSPLFSRFVEVVHVWKHYDPTMGTNAPRVPLASRTQSNQKSIWLGFLHRAKRYRPEGSRFSSPTPFELLSYTSSIRDSGAAAYPTRFPLASRALSHPLPLSSARLSASSSLILCFFFLVSGL